MTRTEEIQSKKGRLFLPSPPLCRSPLNTDVNKSVCSPTKRIISPTGGPKTRMGGSQSKKGATILPSPPLCRSPSKVSSTGDNLSPTSRSRPTVPNPSPPLYVSPTNKKRAVKVKKRLGPSVQKEREVTTESRPVDAKTMDKKEEEDFVATLRRATYWKGQRIRATNHILHLENERERLLLRLEHFETAVLESLARVARGEGVATTAK